MEPKCPECGANLLHSVDWESEPKPEFGDNVVSFKYRCKKCGKEFEDVYEEVGLWDPETKDYFWEP